MTVLDQKASELNELLAREIGFIKSGNFAEAIALTSEKRALLREFEIALQEEGVSREALPVVQDVIKRAGECEHHFLAVRNGMRRVIERLQNLDHDSYVGSYNQYGDKMAFTGATGGTFKKI